VLDPGHVPAIEAFFAAVANAPLSEPGAASPLSSWQDAPSLAEAVFYFEDSGDARGARLEGELARWKKRAALALDNSYATEQVAKAKEALLAETLRCRAELIERLKDGELVASGFFVSRENSNMRQRIDTGLWDSLLPNLQNSTAAAGRLEIVGIRVCNRDRVPECAQPTPPSDEVLKRNAAAIEEANRRAAASGRAGADCPVCGERFKPSSLRQKNCSRKCTERASKERCAKRKAATQT
jgi:hypothetical protein